MLKMLIKKVFKDLDILIEAVYSSKYTVYKRYKILYYSDPLILSYQSKLQVQMVAFYWWSQMKPRNKG